MHFSDLIAIPPVAIKYMWDNALQRVIMDYYTSRSDETGVVVVTAD